MDKTSSSIHAPDGQREVPFADERNRYLLDCASRGATPAALKIKRNELLWIARHLNPNACQGVDLAVLLRIGGTRQSIHGATTAVQRVVDIGRPWLRFLGWWRKPPVLSQYQGQLDQYVAWMRDDRGFTPSTVEQWERMARRFLRWCEKRNHQLTNLQAVDIDDYFATQGIGRWSRVSMVNTASALRGFLRYAETQGMCTANLAASISRPRLYRHESLPYAPDWSDVQRMLADADTNKPRDIRDRAILLLLAVYGLRSGEVAALRLDQIDWTGRTVRVFRLKRRQPQVYPLLSSVAEALSVYIDTVRPPSTLPEVFLCMQAPLRRIKAGSIYDVAKRRFVALGIEAAHRGGHAFRHACAVRLLAVGLTL